VQEKYERECKVCGKKKEFLWKEISRWMRANKGRPLDDWLCHTCNLKNRNTTHGESKIPLYTHWKSMFTRTKGRGDPNTLKYYVAKGIQVCPEWYDYPVFKKWAESHRFKPNSGLVLDRINGSQNYTPDNCQWLTKSEHSSKHYPDNSKLKGNTKNATA
jgi:hypothetical protein